MAVMRVAVLAVALGTASPAFAGVEVQTDAAGRVSVHAEAPAVEILDRLAAQTGMKVVYEGGGPRTRVSVSFERRTPAEAVLMVLQGLGYDYLIRFDRTGTRPELLMISGPSSNASRPLSAGAPQAPGRPMQPVEPAGDEEEEGDDAAEEIHEVPAVRVPDLRQRAQPTQPAPSTQPAFGARPAPSYPVSPFAPASPGLPSLVTPPSPPPEPEEPTNENPNT